MEGGANGLGDKVNYLNEPRNYPRCGLLSSRKQNQAQGFVLFGQSYTTSLTLAPFFRKKQASKRLVMPDVEGLVTSKPCVHGCDHFQPPSFVRLVCKSDAAEYCS